MSIILIIYKLKQCLSYFIACLNSKCFGIVVEKYKMFVLTRKIKRMIIDDLSAKEDTSSKKIVMLIEKAKCIIKSKKSSFLQRLCC